MAHMILFDGPEPLPGRVWCAICLGLSKQAVIERCSAAIREATIRGKDTDPPLRLTVTAEDGPQGLAMAVTRTISPTAPMLGPVDCCWSHGAALDATAHALQPAGPQHMAALGGGVPLG